MKRFVFLKIDRGDFESGFPVTLKIASPDRSSFLEVEIDCQLPPHKEIEELYNNWLSAYQAIPSIPEASDLIRKALLEECSKLAKKLKSHVQTWLNTSNNPKFQKLREALCKYLDPEDEILVFLQTREEILKKLPWHEWDLCSDRFPKAEIALSPPEIELIPQGKLRTGQNSVKILSILGDSKGIDIESDRELITNLPSVDPEFLIEPDRQEFSSKLWEKDWDILFFAGHSNSTDESGIIYINSEDRLPIEELKNSLRKVSDLGLQLAIFNSCDGLKLAEYLAELNIPQIIVMREPVPDEVAQLFLEYFLQAYSEGESLYFRSSCAIATRSDRTRLSRCNLDTHYLSKISRNSSHMGRNRPWNSSRTFYRNCQSHRSLLSYRRISLHNKNSFCKQCC